MARRRFHPVWLLIAALALASWSGDAARFMKPPPDHEATTGTKASAKRSDGRKSRKKTPVTSMKVAMIPVYPEGSLLVEVSKPKPKPRQEAKRKPKPRQGEKQANIPALPNDGERPNLSVSYENIGLEKYLTILEHRVGVMFALITNEKGMAVGPEIDLLRGEVKPRNEIVIKRLATKRPHIVHDPELYVRLGRLPLPAGAAPDRAIFYFFRWMDEVLWRTIATTLSRRGYQFKDIASIQARYMTGTGTSVYLDLISAVHKDGGKMKLGEKIWVTL